MDGFVSVTFIKIIAKFKQMANYKKAPSKQNHKSSKPSKSQSSQKNKERVLPKVKEKIEKVERIRFVKSAVLPKDYPPFDRKEVAFAGRSNAGKSSLINAITHSSIAKISNTPGKTTLLNFFDVADKYRLVDMPGYGYAARSWSERDAWKDMIEDYINIRQTLVGMVLVMDIRRDWSADEDQFLRWLSVHDIPILVVLSKADKLKKSELPRRIQELRKQAQVESMIAVSSVSRDNVSAVEDYIYKNWIEK